MQNELETEFKDQSPTRIPGDHMDVELPGANSDGGNKPIVEPLQIIELSFGNLQAVKSIGRIVTNLCSSEGGSTSQNICVEQGLI